MSCPTMLRRVAEDAGPLLALLVRSGIGPQVLARAHPGDLARAVHNCLDCLDRAECEDPPAQVGVAAQVPRSCANRDGVCGQVD